MKETNLVFCFSTKMVAIGDGFLPSAFTKAPFTYADMQILPMEVNSIFAHKQIYP